MILAQTGHLGFVQRLPVALAIVIAAACLAVWVLLYRLSRRGESGRAGIASRLGRTVLFVVRIASDVDHAIGHFEGP